VINRRKLLLYSAIVAGGAAITASITIYSWWDTPPQEPYTHINKKEAQLVSLVAGAAYPKGKQIDLDGSEAQIDRFFDLFLNNLTEEKQNLLKLLLQVTERISLLSHRAYFSDLSKEQQQHCIENLLQHDQHLVRSAYQSLIAILGMGYTTHPDVVKKLSSFHRCGYG